jgi:fructose-1,6-bisphosphatase/inositol monophosphatase family enzyme
VWDAENWRAVGEPVVDAAVYDFAFSASGRTLAVATEHGLESWDAAAWQGDDARVAASLCAIAGRNLSVREWGRFLPDVPHHVTCPQWSDGA